MIARVNINEEPRENYGQADEAHRIIKPRENSTTDNKPNECPENCGYYAEDEESKTVFVFCFDLLVVDTIPDFIDFRHSYHSFESKIIPDCKD